MSIPLIEKQSHLSEMLGAGIGSLDISRGEREAVIARYKLLGAALDTYWQDSFLENLVYPQGSFALGTVTRSVHRNDEVDIDLVVVRGLSKYSTTQANLKRDTGMGLREFVQHSDAGGPLLSESDRCWTLEYPGMHIDVLPAIPDGKTETGIEITDKAVFRWQPSDPKGYAQWFNDVGHPEWAERQWRLKTSGVDVAEVPDWRQKTNLQLSVQALKRHRDIYFADRLGRRPSSIVITTLAALAYERASVNLGNEELYEAIRAIAGGLEDGIDRVNGLWVIENPAMPGENFADYWVDERWRASDLLEWISAVQQDISGIPASSGNDVVLERIGTAFGGNVKVASARAISEPILAARQSGQLRSASGTGMLSAASLGVRPVRSHTFHGGRRRQF
ncbi:cyclic GMP-AMP synthase DncV-like nucleotidyltransferase [Mycobacterium sp. NPDC049093]